MKIFKVYYWFDVIGEYKTLEEAKECRGIHANYGSYTNYRIVKVTEEEIEL